MARRILSIWFPRMASDIALRKRPVEGPFALIHRSGNANHLHCLNKAAEARKLHRGMALADARAICPDLTTDQADLPREATALKQLGRWANRYSPMVSCDGSDGLIVDVTGVPHLFGGETGLREDLHARLDRMGIKASSAIAETRGAAFACARHGGGIIPEGEVRQRIESLPVSALRIDESIAQALNRVGLRRIGDLTPLPRAPLARRYGSGLLLRLDQAFGVQRESVAPDAAPPHFGVRMTIPEPIGLQADVMAAVSRLLERLCRTLDQHHQGARRVRLELRRVDRETVVIDIGLARPMRDAQRIAALFVKGVENADAGFGIDALRLVAYVTEPLPPEQLGGGPPVKQDDALADLLSRLGNRLGFDRILRMLPVESKIPERSFLLSPAAHSVSEPFDRQPGPDRPFLIFPPEPVTTASMYRPGYPPATFRWRRMKFTTFRAMGPERITPDWWCDDPAWRAGLRDYWRIETREGPRLWLFHTPKKPNWYAQGEFP